jgi:pimeloyl-ACP methyl ester carboxylesterase
VILVAQVDPRPEAQQALTTLFTSTASQTEVLDAMNWMVGSPKKRVDCMGAVQGRSGAIGCRLAGGSRASHSAAGLVGTARRRPVPRDSRDEGRSRARREREELGERGTVVDIPNAGHLQPLEAPGPVAETVIAFAR